MDAATITPQDLNAECHVKGFDEVCVYTDDDPLTKSRIYSDDRVWCLLEIYKNQKCGLRYAENQFTIADWITASTWGRTVVTRNFEFADGETKPYTGRRTAFHAILEGRPVAEQVVDICRSGALSVPFQHEGEFTITPFRAATTTELNDARVFTDRGQSVNIIWEGEPLLEFSQIPNTKLDNEIEVEFEEASNYDAARIVIVDDPDQKLKAGRQLGTDYSQSVTKKYSGFGVNGLPEALGLARRILWFGEFDEGGTQNNLRATLTVPFEQALGLKRYQIIKIESTLLTDFPTIGAVGFTETPQYFRILRLRKISGGRCEITAQAYNHTAYVAHEVETVISIGATPAIFVLGAGTTAVNGGWGAAPDVNDRAAYSRGIYTLQWDGTKWDLGPGLYSSLDNVDYPYQAVFTVDAGRPPAPFVVSFNPVYYPPCELTAGVATYDAENGQVVVPILPC